MTFKENESIELKSIVTEDIKKEIVAFANSNGGKIYIGIEDNGNVIGVDDLEFSSLQVSNMIRDAIKPDITMFIDYKTVQTGGKNVIEIDVQRGSERPYYIAKKGLRPEGVYVRQGYSSVPASNNAIRRMIIETDGDHFEEMRSMEQELTFNETRKEFDARSIEFDISQFKTLKILNNDGIYTNLALLLSDQCVHTIKAAVFQGDDDNIFKNRQEFSGSILGQMNEAYEYIDRYNQIHSSFDGLLRVDTRDYPPVAVREALLNLLVHRDYSFSASALIKIYSNRIEFISVGALVSGIEIDDIMTGVSVCRNNALANVFYRLELIEAYGTGIRKILKAYEAEEKKPMFKCTSNTFKVILPNINAEDETEAEISVENEESLDSERRVLAYAKAYGAVTRADTEKILDVSASTAFRFLKQMSEEKKLVSKGKGRSVKYVLPCNIKNKVL